MDTEKFKNNMLKAFYDVREGIGRRTIPIKPKNIKDFPVLLNSLKPKKQMEISEGFGADPNPSVLSKLFLNVSTKIDAKRVLWVSMDNPNYYKTYLKNSQTFYKPVFPSLLGIKISEFELNSYPLYKITSISQSSKFQGRGKNVFFLHGGGFSSPPTFLHWMSISEIVRLSDATVYMPRYPLAPLSTYSDTLEHIYKAYNLVLNQTEGNISTVMGDSAGGSLSLALASTLPENMQPEQYIVLSPAADMSLKPSSDESALEKRKDDPLLDFASIEKILSQYPGDIPQDSTLINLVNADYSKAGFLYIYAGGKDALSVETNYLVDELKKAGIPHKYIYQEHMPHDWFLFNFPESSRLREEIAKKISE